MSLSHWSGPAARASFEQAYADALALWPLAYESRFVETPYGTTHVVVSGDREGPPVVLLHAAALTANQWARQAFDLGTANRLYAVDIVGDLGLSTQSRVIRSRDDAAAWLAGVLDGLGLDRATLIGSSLGGFQATNLAVAHPDRVAALVLLAPAATIRPFKLVPRLVIRFGGLVPLPSSVRPALRSMMGGTLPDERLVAVMEAGVRGFRYDARGLQPTEIPDEDLARIAAPTLVLLGDREMIYDPHEAARRAATTIRDAEVEVLPGLGHLLGLQAPEAVDRRILAFLAARVEAPVPA